MNNTLGKTLSAIFKERYTIPLYQRNFAWRTEEVQQLLQDVYDAYEKNRLGYYYIGSLVVLKRHTGDYEVIDGQQRLTVVSIIAILLGDVRRPVLSYDSRPEVQTFFEDLCKDPKKSLKDDAATLFYLKEACEHIRSAEVESSRREGTRKIKLADVKDAFMDFFLNHVVLVLNEIPEDTDVAAYFEIMNNRGEQLQKHELVKAQMMEKLKLADGESYDEAKQRQFAFVWDACSQMTIPIQRLFTASRRKEYFGPSYDSFVFPECAAGEGVEKREYSLSEILSGNATARDGDEGDRESEDEVDAYEYGSIIDFPNFLMHVLRLYVQVGKLRFEDEPEIPLNEKELLSAYHACIDRIDPMTFAKLLLFCRTVFDRYVVKTTTDSTDEEDGRKWVLVKPRKYDNSWKFTASFEGAAGSAVVKAISLLQVTFRSRVYKNWLFKVLVWFHEECFEAGALSNISAAKYLAFLHGYLLNYYGEQKFDIREVGEDICLTAENSYSQGTGTPHFLLNFIDYLYWCRSLWDEGFKVKDFDFKYWNSVEHHLAQNKVPEDCTYIDNLGNLCLVSKRANSRLSDRDVKEKVEVYGNGNLGSNRQIMYEETRRRNWNWGEPEIRAHYNELAALLSQREEILNAASKSVATEMK